jgi:hypothetical protein
MTKHKLLIIAFIGLLVLVSLLCGNGHIRTFLRAITDDRYPKEVAKIEHDTASFDLSSNAPARLAIGVRYPVSNTPPEINITDFKIAKPIAVKFLQSNQTIKSDTSDQVHILYHDFDKTGYKVAVIYTFTWSPYFIHRNTKIEFKLNDQFKNFDLILFDYGIK